MPDLQHIVDGASTEEKLRENGTKLSYAESTAQMCAILAETPHGQQ